MHKVQKERDLNSLLLKFQKPVVLFLFFAILLVFVYSLVYMTPFFELYKADSYISSANLEKYGLSLSEFDESLYLLRNGRPIGINVALVTDFLRQEGLMQDFNRWMFAISIIGIVVTCLLFVYFSQKRKRYYVTNFVSFGVVAAFDLYVGFSMILNLTKWKQYVSQINYTIINAFLSSNNLEPTLVNYFGPHSFDWVFVVGYIVAAIIMLAAVVGVVLAVCKYLYQRKNAPIDTSEVNINE